MILAGDIGGTKCNLAIFREADADSLQPIFERRYSTRDFSRFEDVIEQFRRQAAEAGVSPAGERIRGAGFGVAGAVVEGRLHANNLPWALNLPELARRLEVSPENIVLLNDVVATAWGLDRLPAEDLAPLNQGVLQPNATRALMAVGTGLGEALLVWDGRQYRVFPSEGGLADFAPRTEREIQLLIHLKKRLPNVCCEDVLSGRGIRAIHEFLDPNVRHPSFDGSGADPAREITEQASAQTCPVCVTTLDLWTEAYGSAAGNLALQALALGGVYVAGGIAPKILAKLKDGTFFRAFCDKTKLSPVLARIPIYVVLNENAPVWGAAYRALAAAHSSPMPQPQRKAG
ncbi:MAG TPA: glucokinase [Terriglobales bacterium]|jgi:glucokinase|nr:glucokinase [Terriglobales bacterium]